MKTRSFSVGHGLVGFLISLIAVDVSADAVARPTRSFGLGDVQRIVVSLDRRFLATSGQGGAFLWDFQTGALRQRLETDGPVTALAFSPDGEFLLGADRTTIRSWTTTTGEARLSYTGHTGEINDLEFSAGGRSFVSASADQTARIWSFDQGTELHRVDTPGASIGVAVFSPDERLLVTGDSSTENSVKIWEIGNDIPLRTLPKSNWSPTHLLFTPSGHLITAAVDQSLLMWDVETAQPVRAFAGVGGAPSLIRCVWMASDSMLAAMGSDGRVFTWNIETEGTPGIVAGDLNIVAVGIPGAWQAVVAHLDFKLRLLEWPAGAVRRTFEGHTTSTHLAVAFSPDGRHVLSGGTEAAVRLWDRKTGAAVRNFVGTGSGTMAAAFSPDGSNVLTTVGLPLPAVRLWRTATGELLREYRWSGSWPMSAALSQDGTRIAAGAQDDRVRVFDTASGNLVRTLAAPGWARAVAFSPSAPLLATGSSDSNVRVFNHQTGQLLRTLFAEAGSVVTVAFAPDGATLLVAWNDGLVRLFSAVTFDLVGEIGVPAFVESAAYSPDGKYLLTGEGWPEFTATIRDTETLEPVRTFTGHKWSVNAVAFSATGASVLTAGEVVREWPTADLAARLRSERRSDQLRLSWSFGTLQRAPSVAGPWQSLSEVVSPFSVPIGEGTGFFRVLAEPEE